MNLTANVSGMQRFPLVRNGLTASDRRLLQEVEHPSGVCARRSRNSSRTQAAAGRTTELLRSSKAELYQRFIAWRRGDSNKPTKKPSAPRLSLKDLFRQFIADEVARIGKSNVLALGKPELYRRFIEWRRQGQLSSYTPVPKPKPVARSEQSLKQLFRQFIALEVGRIGKSNVLALPKPSTLQAVRGVAPQRPGRQICFPAPAGHGQQSQSQSQA